MPCRAVGGYLLKTTESAIPVGATQFLKTSVARSGLPPATRAVLAGRRLRLKDPYPVRIRGAMCLTAVGRRHDPPSALRARCRTLGLRCSSPRPRGCVLSDARRGPAGSDRAGFRPQPAAWLFVIAHLPVRPCLPGGRSGLLQRQETPSIVRQVTTRDAERDGFLRPHHRVVHAGEKDGQALASPALSRSDV